MNFLVVAPTWRAEEVLHMRQYNLEAFHPKIVETAAFVDESQCSFVEWGLLAGVSGKGLSINVPNLATISEMAKTLNNPLIFYFKGGRHDLNEFIPIDHEGVIVIYDSYIE